MDNEGVKEIADLARSAAAVEIKSITEPSVRKDPVFLAAVPNGSGDVELVSVKSKLDEWREKPERIKGTAKALTVDAFVGLVDRHKSEHTAIFGNLNVDSPSFTAVIDYHSVDHEPAWLGHRVSYAFPLSDEWKAWKGTDSSPMKQEVWAAFIEDHVADLASPLDQERSTFETLFKTKFATPADLVTMSRGMEISVNARVKEVRTLQSGEAEVVYEEVHSDGRGERLVVPGLFIVAIPLFTGAEPERLICRLRYRKQDARIVWLYQMYRPETVVREYLERTLIDVGERTSLPVFEAAPEA